MIFHFVIDEVPNRFMIDNIAFEPDCRQVAAPLSEPGTIILLGVGLLLLSLLFDPAIKDE